MGAVKVIIPPSGNGCWKRTRDRLAALVVMVFVVLFILVVFVCCWFFFVGVGAFDGNDNSQSAWVCNKYFHLFFVILKIPEKNY